jgi:probable blue pigment (indigoidine) exporter
MTSLARPSNGLLLVLAAASWGSGTAISKQAVAAIPPGTLLGIQLVVSIAFLVGAAVVRGESMRTGPQERSITRLGLLNPGLAYALGLLGLVTISASLSVVIWAIEPILILVLAAVLLHERVSGWLVALSTVAVLGLVFVLVDPSLSGAMLGVAISASGVLCCAIYTVATRRWIAGSDSTLAVVVGQEAWALVVAIGLIVVTAAAGQPVVPSSASAGVLASAVASGLLYYGVAYWLYLSALRHLPASIAATSFYLIPVFGLATAGAFGERLEPAQWLGSGVVIAAMAGVGFFQRRAFARPTARRGSA